MIVNFKKLKSKQVAVLLSLCVVTAFSHAEDKEDENYYNTSITYTCSDPKGCPDDVDPNSMTQKEIDAYNAEQQRQYELRLQQAEQQYQNDLQN